MNNTESNGGNLSGTSRSSIGVSRRTFVRLAGAAGVALTALDIRSWALERNNEGMFYRTLGSTGKKVSAIGLGGYHMGKPLLESTSIKIVRTAVDRGMTFMDNCWDYHDGKSEQRMGKALRDGYREKVFLMTKIDGRSREGAAKQIDESLRRLQTDHLDLLQFHEVIRMNDPERIFAPGGALEAVLEAKKQGKLRFIGFTGHKDPAIHLHMLEVAEKHQFKFDTVQMPLNVMDAHLRSFGEQVLPVLVKQGIGVQAFEAARTFKPMSQQEVAALLAKTAQAASVGEFERFKTSQAYDSTSKNPEYLD